MELKISSTKAQNSSKKIKSKKSNNREHKKNGHGLHFPHLKLFKII